MDGTRLYALIGNPVAHSRSPFIMNRAFAAAGVDAEYIALPVPGRDLRAAIEGLALMQAGGANVTYPYKESVIDHLGGLSDDAALLGAVNTLVWTDGSARGHNTDAPGVALALERIAGVDAKGARVFIFGAGGAARAAALGMLRAGATAVTLGARSREKARVAVAPLAAAGYRVDVVGLGDDDRVARGTAVAGAEIVINATPVGMPENGVKNGAPLVDDASWIGARQCFFDFVYHPRRTAFLESARVRGATIVGGLELLVSQAAAAFELWTGRAFDAVEMFSALEATGSGDTKA